jgi:carbon-monoxide dehydrogenase medium subunit
MQLWQDYHTPTTVEDALQQLKHYASEARIIAGGTDLLIDLQFNNDTGHGVKALVDVTNIPEMTRITEQAENLCYIGGAVTHTAIVKSALIEARATCLVESCGVVGGPQVRNVGTLGGNVAHALPAGDGTTSLVALDAEAEVAWHDGRREWLPIARLFKGAGISALDSRRDILVGFRFKLCGEREATAFKRIMRPQGVALPVLGCAVWVRLDESRERYQDARICIGPVSTVPERATGVENALSGQLANETTLTQAAQVAHDSLHPRTSKYRATAEYRDHMIETLLRQALPLAVRRAQTGAAQAEGVGMG